MAGVASGMGPIMRVVGARELEAAGEEGVAG